MLVREIPALLGETDVKGLVRDIADDLAENGQALALKERLEEVCGTMACHGSVRAGRRLNAAGDERPAAPDGGHAPLRPVQPRPPDLCRAEARRHRAAVRAAVSEEEAVTLWRPVGPAELRLIEESAMREFPPRLADQPIFYPVLSEDYAIKIARDWNVPASGKGYVTRFRVRRAFLDRYEIREAGGRSHLEYWIPAEELADFNAAIIGEIEVVASFP